MRRVLVVAALLLAACQQAPVSPTPTSSAVSPAQQLRAEGDALMAKGDYQNAVEKYRQLADLEPAAVAPRFALGTAYSFLEKRPEAIVQFRWVLSRADAGSTEYQEAQRWLARVGALPIPTAVADTTPQRNQPRVADASTTGRLSGRTEWPDITPQRRLITGNVSLTGDEPVTQDWTRTRPFRLGDAYEFKDVPAGRYRLVAVIDQTTVWDEKVTIEAGKETNLTLSQSSSPVPAGRFTAPPAAGAGSPEASSSR